MEWQSSEALRRSKIGSSSSTLTSKTNKTRFNNKLPKMDKRHKQQINLYINLMIKIIKNKMGEKKGNSKKINKSNKNRLNKKMSNRIRNLSFF